MTRHNICGYEWYIAPNDLLHGHRCGKCFGSYRKNTEQFRKEVYDLYKDEYTVIGEYINSCTKILMKHNLCNNSWYVEPNSFLRGKGKCPKCAGLLPYTTDTYKEKVYQLTKDEYEVLGEYKNNRTKILMKHNICGNKWKVVPNAFIQGSRCPYCNESKGEKKIRNWLEENKIKSVSQYTFNNCKRKQCLLFDFAIFDNLNNLKCLIEYDGEYHYLPIEGKRRLRYQQENDQLKNNYCHQNNIPLIRIPYWDFDNIEFILTNELSKYLN